MQKKHERVDRMMKSRKNKKEKRKRNGGLVYSLKLAFYAMIFMREARTIEAPMTVAIPVFGAELHPSP